MTFSCATMKEGHNPFLSDFTTRREAPPFDRIATTDYEPAARIGMKEQNANIAAIINNKEKPTFANTIAALDNSAGTLNRVGSIFYNMASAETNDSLRALAIRLAPAITEHSDNILLNAALFARVEEVYNQRAALGLTPEEERLLEKTYKGFVRAGVQLDAAKQARLRKINKELSTLGLQFSNHLLTENNTFKVFVSDSAELAGLPAWFRESAATEARAAGKPGQWLFTLHAASRLPLLQYASNRALREKIYKGYINTGNRNDANDNKDIIRKILALRLERANLLGYPTYAEMALDRTMAKKPENVLRLLNDLWAYALPKAKAEAADLQAFMDKEGKGERLAPWDWWYYAEQVRKERYNLTEEETKPYFRLENVRQGAFDVAGKLYGLTFTPIKDVPVYHPDVEAFEVKDADGSLIGLFYTDFFPRAGKRSGAWMSNFRKQKEGVRPFVVNVCNFTKPTGDTPSLLTIDEVETLFHEFGHALHGLLSQCKYESTSGTSVSRDFVELPSQIYEHWALHPEVLKMYAKHYRTGEVIPDALIKKIQAQATFNQGFATTELLAAALLDMRLHLLTNTDSLDVLQFEQQTMADLGLIPEIAPRYRTTYFNHIIGGYAAGYYSYIWANVLDTDAFEAFRANGVFDAATARSFRTNVLERGDSEDPMVLYRRFRGAEPDIRPLLKARGLTAE